ncbi:hypothetical protein GI374_00890 [Paracoccus sp. S-4012]|uniref:hypothetical protein n=1 Tax=Paracoccus sp. S-4012 TaxID=2665648 RepID=UPI0012B0A06B|nr:hypothetical protein [Paracoccus sp. S-4012]MRX49014.1 hypothetical protein [Paracoccus sp. S-4012]
MLVLLLSAIDVIALSILGAINAWGASISRTIAVGTVVLCVFSYYYVGADNVAFSSAFKEATELFLLFGYTKHSPSPSHPTGDSMMLANALAGVVWYIVAVPTVVNKLTRIR